MASVGGQPARQQVAGLCWPLAAPQSRGAGSHAPPTAIAFLAIPLIYFETPAHPTSPSTFPGGQRSRPAAVPYTAPRPVPVPCTLVPLPTALVLPGHSRAPGVFAQSRGYQAVVLCHHLSVRLLDLPLLESCRQLLAKLPRGPAGSSWTNGWALRWPCGQAYVTGVTGGVAAGTAGARPLSVACRVCQFCLGMGGLVGCFSK